MIIFAGTERYVEIALLRRKRLTPLYSRFISFSMIVQLAQQTTSFLAGETACRLNRKSLRCRAADIVLLAIINASFLRLPFVILFDDFRSSVIYLLWPIKRPDVRMMSSFFYHRRCFARKINYLSIRRDFYRTSSNFYISFSFPVISSQLLDYIWYMIGRTIKWRTFTFPATRKIN